MDARKMKINKQKVYYTRIVKKEEREADIREKCKGKFTDVNFEFMCPENLNYTRR